MNGGFGILKPEAVNSERTQARVTSKWVVEKNRESLSSRVELFGGESNAEPFIISLPKGFALTELTNSNGPIPYLQSSLGGKCHVQVLAERKTLEVSDLWIQASGETLYLADRFIDGTWNDIPWIALPEAVTSDQTMELYASESVAIQLESEPTILFGKGQLLPTIKLSNLYTNGDSSGSKSLKHRLLERNQPLEGQLTLNVAANSSLREIEMVGLVSQSISSMPYFVLEIPASLKDRWQSELKVQVVPSSVSDKALLKVYLAESPSNVSGTEAKVVVRFVPKSDELQSDSELVSQIFALDKDRIIMSVAEASLALDDSSKVVSPSAGNSVDDSINDYRRTLQIFLQVNNKTNESGIRSGEVWSEAVYWIEPNIVPSQADGKLEWRVADGVEVLTAEVNGRPAELEQDLGKVRCRVPQVGLTLEVKLFLKHRTSVDAGAVSIDVPQLLGYDAKAYFSLNVASGFTVNYSGETLASTGRLQMIRIATEASLSAIENGERQWPNIALVERGSDLEQWKRHWFQRVHRCFSEWARLNDDGEDNSFGQATRRWHALKLSLGDIRPDEYSDPRTSGLFNSQTEEDVQTAAGTAVASSKGPQAQQWYSLIGCLLVLLVLVSGSHAFGTVLFERPWWCFIALGAFAWLICGSVILTLALGTIGLFVAADSYWIVTSRLRRIGIRGPRSP